MNNNTDNAKEILSQDDTEMQIFHHCSKCNKIITSEECILEIKNSLPKKFPKQTKKGNPVLFRSKQINDIDLKKKNYIIESNNIICKFCKNKIGIIDIINNYCVGFLNMEAINSKTIQTLKTVIDKNIEVNSKKIIEYISLSVQSKWIMDNIETFYNNNFIDDLKTSANLLSTIQNKTLEIENMINNKNNN
jgi:hypothetical protein